MKPTEKVAFTLGSLATITMMRAFVRDQADPVERKRLLQHLDELERVATSGGAAPTGAS